MLTPMFISEHLQRSLENKEVCFELYLKFSPIFGRVIEGVIVSEHFVVVELSMISPISIGERLQCAEAMEADIVGIILVNHKPLLLLDILTTVFGHL